MTLNISETNSFTFFHLISVNVQTQNNVVDHPNFTKASALKKFIRRCLFNVPIVSTHDYTITTLHH